MKRMPGDEIFRTTLPPGRHKLPRDFVEQHQRARLFAAIVELVDEQGYPATSLTQIVKRASVARHTFYEHYQDKEELFLAVFEQGSERLGKVGLRAAEMGKGSFQERLTARMAAVLADIARNPVVARVCLTEALSATPATLLAYERGITGFAAMLREGGRAAAPPGAEFPDALEDILVGGVVWMVSKRLTTDPESVEALLPDLIEFMVAPYLGEAAALDAARAARESLPTSGDGAGTDLGAADDRGDGA